MCVSFVCVSREVILDDFMMYVILVVAGASMQEASLLVPSLLLCFSLTISSKTIIIIELQPS